MNTNEKTIQKLLLSGLAALTIYSRFYNIDISTTYAKVNYDVFDLEAHGLLIMKKI